MIRAWHHRPVISRYQRSDEVERTALVGGIWHRTGTRQYSIRSIVSRGSLNAKWALMNNTLLKFQFDPILYQMQEKARPTSVKYSSHHIARTRSVAHRVK
jgi:hypothetical protein